MQVIDCKIKAFFVDLHILFIYNDVNDFLIIFRNHYTVIICKGGMVYFFHFPVWGNTSDSYL